MRESTIADFVARFLGDSTSGPEPEWGRVVLSPKRIVLVSGAGRKTIPLQDVFDVVVGHVPSHLTEFFDDTVAIAYTRDSRSLTAIVETDGETATKFRTVLFKALLRGATVQVKHPARVGGRITDASLEESSLRLEERSVSFEGVDPPLRIELSDITYYQTVERSIDGRSRPVLEIQFASDEETIATEILLDSPRLMTLLGRYLKLEYTELVSEMRDVELSEVELDLLTAVYSGAGAETLPVLLDGEPDDVARLLDSLEQRRLLANADGGVRLTQLGRLAVSDRSDRANA